MWRRSTLWLAGLFLLCAGARLDGREHAPVQVPVFTAGANGYHTYRIPALLVSPKGTLLAFAEGRKQGRGDSGDIDLVLRRSRDHGQTWQALQVVWDDGPNTCGNPCPVLDRTTGTIWLLLTHNLGPDTEAQLVAGKGKGTRTVWVSRSPPGRPRGRPRECSARALSWP